MKNRWNVLRLAGLGFIGGFVLFLVRTLIGEAGTSLQPAALLWVVFLGGIGGAALFAVAATVRNLFSK